MERDIVLVLTGGVMQGVFGGGVVTAFQEADLYQRIHSIYSASSGAHNAAYFLARQTRLGSSIYYEDLIDRRFIHPDRIGRFILDCLVHWLRPRHQVSPLVDLDYLIDVVETRRKPLNLHAIVTQGIPWWVHTYDITHHTWRWLDGTVNTLQALRASSSSAPYYSRAIAYQGMSLIDGSVIRSGRLLDVARQHPDKKVIYVRNRRRTGWLVIAELPGRAFDAVLIGLLFGWRVGIKMFLSAFDFPSSREIRRLPNVILIENRVGRLARETHAGHLRQIYAHGIEAGQRALNQL